MKFVMLENGINLFVGENAMENWAIIDKYKKRGSPSCTWFHLTSFPSCHVFLEIEPNKLTDEYIQKAAEICKQNTKHKNARNIKVDYTAITNIEKGTEYGSVDFKSLRKVNVIKI